MDNRLHFKTNQLLKYVGIILFIFFGVQISVIIIGWILKDSDQMWYNYPWVIFVFLAGRHFYRLSNEDNTQIINKEINLVIWFTGATGIYMAVQHLHMLLPSQIQYFKFLVPTLHATPLGTILLIIAFLTNISRKANPPNSSTLNLSIKLLIISGIIYLTVSIITPFYKIGDEYFVAVIKLILKIIGFLLLVAIPFTTFKRREKIYYILMISIGLFLIFLSTSFEFFIGTMAILIAMRIRKIINEKEFVKT